MKREGHQHGMVRTYPILQNPLNPRPGTRFVNRYESQAMAGLFTRVSSKPANHSKFAGKCGQPRCKGCQLYRTCKVKDKSRGNQKKSTDAVSNHKLFPFRVVDARPGLKFSGVSATRVLDQLSSYYADDDDDDDDDGDDDEVSDCDGDDDHDHS